MFFLIRMAFWLGLILLLLPIGTASDGGREIGAWQAISAVQSAVADASGFCERQPDACAVGGDVLVHLTDKAQAGAKWIYEHVGSARPADAGDKSAPVNALTPQDLVPAWGGQGEETARPQPATPPIQPASVPLPPRRPA